MTISKTDHLHSIGLKSGLKIHLNEIPAEGKSFTLSSQTGELNLILQDLIGTHEHEVHLHIHPLTEGTFSLKGTIKAQSPEQCSRCGQDFDWPILESVDELLIPTSELGRSGKYAKTNHFSDLTADSPSVTEIKPQPQGLFFDLGEFIHEIIATAIPFNPSPACDAQEKCTLCNLQTTQKNFGFQDSGKFSGSPFATLQKLKKS